jgi:hypothetical protein
MLPTKKGWEPLFYEIECVDVIELFIENYECANVASVDQMVEHRMSGQCDTMMQYGKILMMEMKNYQSFVPATLRCIW